MDEDATDFDIAKMEREEDENAPEVRLAEKKRLEEQKARQQALEMETTMLPSEALLERVLDRVLQKKLQGKETVVDQSGRKRDRSPEKPEDEGHHIGCV